MPRCSKTSSVIEKKACFVIALNSVLGSLCCRNVPCKLCPRFKFVVQLKISEVLRCTASVHSGLLSHLKYILDPDDRPYVKMGKGPLYGLCPSVSFS